MITNLFSIFQKSSFNVFGGGGGVDSLGSKCGLGREFMGGYNKIGGAGAWTSSSASNPNHPSKTSSLSISSGDMKKVNELYKFIDIIFYKYWINYWQAFLLAKCGSQYMYLDEVHGMSNASECNLNLTMSFEVNVYEQQ